MHLKMLSAKWRPFHLGLNVLNNSLELRYSHHDMVSRYIGYFLMFCNLLWSVHVKLSISYGHNTYLDLACCTSIYLNTWFIVAPLYQCHPLMSWRLQKSIHKEPGCRFNMPSYQHRNYHCGDKMILWSSYLHNGIAYTGETISLYWIRTP